MSAFLTRATSAAVLVAVVSMARPLGGEPQPTPASLLKGIEWLASPHQYGGACLRIRGARTIYIDPAHLGGAAAAVKADLILITHSHDDHLWLETLETIRTPSTRIVTVADVAQALPPSWTGVTVVGPGERVSVDSATIEAVPAYNLASEAHPRSRGWVGYVLTIDGLRLYHSGDTSFTPEMAAVRGIDVAFFTIRPPYMMSGSEVVQAARALRPRVVVPIHWLAAERPEIDYLKEHVPAPTEVVLLPPS